MHASFFRTMQCNFPLREEAFACHNKAQKERRTQEVQEKKMQHDKCPPKLGTAKKGEEENVSDEI